MSKLVVAGLDRIAKWRITRIDAGPAAMRAHQRGRQQTFADAPFRLRPGYLRLARRSASSSQLLTERIASSLAGMPLGNNARRSALRLTPPDGVAGVRRWRLLLRV